MQINACTKKKKKGALRRVLSYWQSYALILPAILTTGLFHYYPIYGIQIAFKNFKNSRGIWGSAWVGLKHFRNMANTMDPSVLINTLSISLYSIAVFPCAVLFALMLNEVRNMRFKKRYRWSATRRISFPPWLSYPSCNAFSSAATAW